MVVLGFILIITGVAMMGTGAGAGLGLLSIGAGAYCISLDNRTKAEMQAAEIGDGCLGNMALVFAVVMVFFLLAMTMTDGQVAVDATNAMDRNVYQPLVEYNNAQGNERIWGTR